MKSMRKWIILPLAIVTLLLAAAVFFAPLIIGVVAENKYTTMLQRLSNNAALTVKVVSYERHWFSSDAILEVAIEPHKVLQIPERASAHRLASFKLTQHIQHGFLLPDTAKLINQHACLNVVPAIKLVIPNCLGLALIHSYLEPAAGKIDATSILAFNGTLTSALYAPELHYRSDELGLTFDAKKVALRLFNTSNLETIKGSFRAADFVSKSPELIQQVTQIDTQFDLRKGPDNLWLGPRKASMKSISWELPAAKGARLGLQDIAVRSANILMNKKINLQVGLSIGDLSMDNAHYGRQEIDLSVNEMDAPAFLFLRKELAAILQKDVIFLSDIQRYGNAALPLLGKGVKIELKKLFISTPWGSSETNAKVYFAPSTVQSAADLLGSLSLDAHFQLPSVFFVKLIETDLFSGLVGLPSLAVPQDRIREQIGMWVKAGLLVPAEKAFIVDVSYKNGQPYVNRRPFDPAAFMAQKIQGTPVINPENTIAPEQNGQTENNPAAAVVSPEPDISAATINQPQQ
jgi:uncharacterized protein YdgA (DUF945 family)